MIRSPVYVKTLIANNLAKMKILLNHRYKVEIHRPDQFPLLHQNDLKFQNWMKQTEQF